MDELKLIPQIYYDIIARVIPGSILISFYFFPYLKNHHGINIICFIIVCSYIIGMVLTLIIGKFSKRIFRYKYNAEYTNERELWDIIRNSKDRNIFTKMMAENRLLQSMTFVLLFIFIAFLVTDNYSNQIVTNFQIKSSLYCIRIIGIVVSLIGCVLFYCCSKITHDSIVNYKKIPIR